jgi:hypothetical protein
MKAKINALERRLDLTKLKLYNHEEKTAALRTEITSIEDELEDIKFEILEKELEQCKQK